MRRSTICFAGMRSRLLALAITLLCTATFASAASASRVLRVGSAHGVRGQFKSIQAAVDAAKPGDWILIGPGDYHPANTRMPSGASSFNASDCSRR